ncbi:MAG: adventurous gliding motility lipoprotein CglC [Myxococcaceae bacterium]
MSLRWTLFVGALACASVTGCAPRTDLGKECTLVRKDPNDLNPSDGISSIPIKESEIVVGKDFISFGATECEDLVCVRDANAPLGDPGADAKGKCSRPCVETNASSCATGDEKVDESADGKFVCRAMLLDTETLALIKEADPVTYKQYFGDTTSPFFCAHPQK